MAFPDPTTYDFPEWLPYGKFFYYARDVISFGDQLTLENLREAYRKGIFPWYINGVPLPWYCPEKRAILEFADLRISRSLAKERKKTRFRFTINEDFRRVMEECSASARNGQSGTWIKPAFIETYTELHETGMAHSVEAWDESDNLVGGLYGVDAGGVFCGESMFYKNPTHQACTTFLIDHLKERGSTWLDAQVMTPHMEALGAKEVSRNIFLLRLYEFQTRSFTLF